MDEIRRAVVRAIAGPEETGKIPLIGEVAKKQASKTAKNVNAVWVGDLSGYTVELESGGGAYVMHHCGKAWPIRDSEYLAHIVVNIIQPHQENGCDE